MTAAVLDYDGKGRHLRTRRIAALLALGALAPVPSARAQAERSAGERVHLRWSRPSGSTCIAERELAAHVEGLLGHRVFVAEERALVRISGGVERRDGRWIATLRIFETGDTTARGERKLEQDGDDCAALTPALTVVIATLVALAQTEAQPEAGVSVVLGAAGAIGFGLLPEPAFGGTLRLGLRPSADWSTWVDATAWLPVETYDLQNRGAVFTAWQAGLSLCRDLPAGKFLSFSACAGADLGLIDGAGRGLSANRSSQRLLAQLGLEAGISIPVFSVVSFRSSAAIAFGLVRSSFFWDQPDGTVHPIFTPPRANVALRAGMSVEIR